MVPMMRMSVVFVPALLHGRDMMSIHVYTYRGYVFLLVAMTIPCMLLALHPNSERHLGDILACAAAMMRIGGCLPICTECQSAIDVGSRYGDDTHCDCWLLDGLVSHRLENQSQAKIANPIFNLRLWVRGFAPSCSQELFTPEAQILFYGSSRPLPWTAPSHQAQFYIVLHPCNTN